MKRTIFTYGIISGLIVAVLLCIAMAMKDAIGYKNGMLVGYTSMILAFSLIFFAIQSYKKQHGSITFGKSFLIGLGITGICSAFYIVTWLIVYYNFMPNYLTDYANYQVDAMRKAGQSEAAVQAALQEMSHFKEMYKNPVWVVLFTLMEIAPVGILVALIAAIIEKIRNKPAKAA